jgi:hypothetical protein
MLIILVHTMRKWVICASLLLLIIISSPHFSDIWRILPVYSGTDQGLSVIEDPEGDVPTTYSWLDVLEVMITQVSGDRIQLDVTLKASPPMEPPEWTKYIWFLDTDFDVNTGQPHDYVGSEYNVRVDYCEGGWHGYVDRITPSGCSQAPIFIDGNIFSISVSREMLGGASGFRWWLEACSESTVDCAGPGSFYFIAFTDEEKTSTLTPASLYLTNGKTEGQIDITPIDGEPSPQEIRFYTSASDLIDVSGTGAVKALSGAFGTCTIWAKIDGVLCARGVEVKVGSAELTPPIMLLSTSGTKEGVLTVEAFDAFGSRIQNTSLQFVSGNPSVATVDDSGTVTAVQPPIHFWDTPYITAYIKGFQAGNSAVVRVTTGDLGLTMKELRGTHVSFYVPEQDLQGFDYEDVLIEGDALHLTDVAYEIEQNATGCTPFNGGIQYLVTDPGHGADGTIPFGLSGNPIRLGVDLDNSVYNSAVSEPYLPATPRYWVFWHEMGHNFLGEQRKVYQLYWNKGPAYGEAFASILGMYTAVKLESRAESMGIPERILAGLRATYHFGDPCDLNKYIKDGPSYAKVDVPVVYDTINYLAAKYGEEVIPRLFSAFMPVDSVFSFTIDSELKQSTLYVTLMSAATGEDQRSLFRSWGFPVDDSFYATIYEEVESGIKENYEAVRGSAWRRSLITLMGEQECTIGSPIRVYGKLMPEAEGLPLKLEYYDGEWKESVVFVSGAGGSFSAEWMSDVINVGTMRLRVVFPGDSTYLGSSVETDYTVKKIDSFLTLHVEDTATLGQPIVTSGNIQPAVPGTSVSIRYSNPDGSSVTHLTNTNTDGAFTDSFTPMMAGVVRVSASFGGDPTHYASSTQVNILVEKYHVTLTMQLEKSQYTSGDVVKVTGKAESNVLPLSLTITFTSSQGTHITRTINTDSAGNFSDSATANVAGDWKVLVEVVEDERVGASRTEAQFTVNPATSSGIPIPSAFILGGFILALLLIRILKKEPI